MPAPVGEELGMLEGKADGEVVGVAVGELVMGCAPVRGRRMKWRGRGGGRGGNRG